MVAPAGERDVPTLKRLSRREREIDTIASIERTYSIYRNYQKAQFLIKQEIVLFFCQFFHAYTREKPYLCTRF